MPVTPRSDRGSGTYITQVLHVSNEISLSIYQLVDGFLSLHLRLVDTVNDVLRYRLYPECASFLQEWRRSVIFTRSESDHRSHLGVQQYVLSDLGVQTRFNLHVQPLLDFKSPRAIDRVTKRVS
jgi:hypothetical protein